MDIVESSAESTVSEEPKGASKSGRPVGGSKKIAQTIVAGEQSVKARIPDKSQGFKKFNKNAIIKNYLIVICFYEVN